MKNVIILSLAVIIIFTANMKMSAQTKLDTMMTTEFAITKNVKNVKYYSKQHYFGEFKGKIVFSKTKLDTTLAKKICLGDTVISDVKIYSSAVKQKINTTVYPYAYAISYFVISLDLYDYPYEFKTVEYSFEKGVYRLYISGHDPDR